MQKSVPASSSGDVHQLLGWRQLRSINESPVDAVADRVRDLILAPGAPEQKPWGTYEFAVSDPDGTLVRIGRVSD